LLLHPTAGPGGEGRGANVPGLLNLPPLSRKHCFCTAFLKKQLFLPRCLYRRGRAIATALLEDRQCCDNLSREQRTNLQATNIVLRTVPWRNGNGLFGFYVFGTFSCDSFLVSKICVDDNDEWGRPILHSIVTFRALKPASPGFLTFPNPKAIQGPQSVSRIPSHPAAGGCYLGGLGRGPGSSRANGRSTSIARLSTLDRRGTPAGELGVKIS
jgi:hypothetical protein